MFNFGIPDELLPDQVLNPDTVTNLFSPTRSRGVNPKDWQFKMTTWSQLIEIYCRHNSLFTFSLASLKHSFQRYNRPPYCLDSVLSDLLDNKEIEVLNEFNKDQIIQNTSLFNMGRSTFKTMLSYMWFKNRNIEENTRFIHLGILKEYSGKILNKAKQTIMTLDEFQEMSDLNEIEAVKLLLVYMRREGLIDIWNFDGQLTNEPILIKFVKKSGDSKLSEYDIAIYRMERMECQLEETCKDLQKQITEFRMQAKEHLGQQNRIMAKSCLKRKHQMEYKLNKKLSVWENVYTLLENLKGVREDRIILTSYKTALATFNSCLKDNKDFNEETIDQTMADLRDALELDVNLKSILSESISTEGNQDEDEAAIQNELDELIQQNKDEEIEKSLQKLSIASDDTTPSTNCSFKQLTLSGV